MPNACSVLSYTAINCVHPAVAAAPELNLVERRNWMIHIHYVRKEFDTCKALVKEQLQETGDMCEYACYIQVSAAADTSRHTYCHVAGPKPHRTKLKNKRDKKCQKSH